MRIKTLLLTAVLVLALAGVIAATAGARWWKASQPVFGRDLALPPASGEYGWLLRQYLINDSAMDISGVIRIYDQEKGGLLRETSGFRLYRAGNQFYNELSYLRTYCDGNLVLVVDTVHRRLKLFKKGPEGGNAAGPAGSPPQLLFGDSSHLGLAGTVAQEQVERVLTVRSDYNPEMKAYRVYYDTATYRIHRTEMEMWKDRSGRDTVSSRVWLAKTEFFYRPRGTVDIAREMQAFVIVGPEGVQPTAAYAGYQVMKNF